MENFMDIETALKQIVNIVGRRGFIKVPMLAHTFRMNEHFFTVKRHWL